MRCAVRVFQREAKTFHGRSWSSNSRPIAHQFHDLPADDPGGRGSLFITCATVLVQGFLDLIYKLKEAEGNGGLPPATAISGILLSDWKSLFWGAATSAIFAFVVSSYKAKD